MENEKRYIRFNAPGHNFHDKVAELKDEYEMGPDKTPMVDFYADNGRLWCVQASDVEIITEKEFFKELLIGKDIFEDEV